jgi:hypothetical protein
MTIEGMENMDRILDLIAAWFVMAVCTVTGIALTFTMVSAIVMILGVNAP